MARLYANENFPLPVVQELRRMGHDVLTTQDVGLAHKSTSDQAILEFGRRERRAVLTLNRRHFVRLHAQAADHPGIVVCTVDPDFMGQAGRIDHAVRSVDVLEGQLLRVNRPSV